MLLEELNLKALNVNAESVLPIKKSINVEGKEIEFKITAFQSGFGNGKKTVISGVVKRVDNNSTQLLENADIEKIRRIVSSLCELMPRAQYRKQTPAQKKQTEVEKLRQSLAVARRLPREWLIIDANKLRAAFRQAQRADKENARKALHARAVAPILDKIEKLSAEERSLLLASLQ